MSDTEQYIDLVGYCDFAGMLTYRLDKDVALVLISAVSGSAPDSVSATIEHMQKVSSDEKAALIQSLAVEWKSVLGSKADDWDLELVSARKPEYWEQPASKLRRIESEPETPKKSNSL